MQRLHLSHNSRLESAEPVCLFTHAVTSTLYARLTPPIKKTRTSTYLPITYVPCDMHTRNGRINSNTKTPTCTADFPLHSENYIADHEELGTCIHALRTQADVRSLAECFKTRNDKGNKLRRRSCAVSDAMTPASRLRIGHNSIFGPGTSPQLYTSYYLMDTRSIDPSRYLLQRENVICILCVNCAHKVQKYNTRMRRTDGISKLNRSTERLPGR